MTLLYKLCNLDTCSQKLSDFNVKPGIGILSPWITAPNSVVENSSESRDPGIDQTISDRRSPKLHLE